MINIALLHKEIKEKVNKVDSNHYKDLKHHQLDSIINQAVFYFKEHFAFVNRMPFENNQSRLDMISPLVVRNKEVSFTQVEDGQYKVTLPENYANLIRGYFYCGNKQSPISIQKHDELTTILNDPYRKPSSTWSRAVGVFGDSTFYVYGKNINKIVIDYIKDHTPVFFGGYNSIEFIDKQRRQITPNQSYSSTTPPVDLELDFSYKDIITDIASYLITGYTENGNLLNIVQSRLNLTS